MKNIKNKLFEFFYNWYKKELETIVSYDDTELKDVIKRSIKVKILSFLFNTDVLGQHLYVLMLNNKYLNEEDIRNKLKEQLINVKTEKELVDLVMLYSNMTEKSREKLFNDLDIDTKAKLHMLTYRIKQEDIDNLEF